MPSSTTAKNDLVPVFVPPLATCLAAAEASKGSRLTEAEVLSIRNGAVCIMMAHEEAAKMAASRGYRDVEPENYWADWNRLRVEFTGNGYLPKIVLCVLGDAELASRCGPVLEAEGVEHEWYPRDERMMSAFQASASQCDPSLMESDLAGIAGHSQVLYVLSKNFTAQDGPSVGRAFLRLGRRLLEAGAVAMKCESSGVAHGRARWLELAGAVDSTDPWPALLRSYVQLPLQSNDDRYTCGMHLIGQPDLVASGALLHEGYGPAEDPMRNAVDLFRAFAYYLLAECLPGRFASGHTFSLDATSPRFRVLWEECTGYDEDDFFFNPFGRWRFAELVK